MKRIVFFLWIFVLSVAAALPVFADEAPEPNISVKAELDKAFITIGDPVTYTVTIRRKPDIQLLSLPQPPGEDIFHIKKIDEFKRRENGYEVQGRKVTLTAFKTGEFVLFPVQINYRTPAGETKTIETQRIYLTVKSVAGEKEMEDIRGLKSVMEIEAQWKKALIIATVVLALLLAGWFLYHFWKKRRAQPAVYESPLTPEQEAMQELSRLFDSDLLRRGKVKDYYLRLSEILRIYFERRYQILAVEFTTDEILLSLKRQQLDARLREKIGEVLMAADLAKFAKWIPQPQEVVQINKKAKEIVEESTPRAEVANGV